MKINELLTRFHDAHSDSVLLSELELCVKVLYIPEDPLSKYTILEDDTGRIEAVPKNGEIFNSLKTKISDQYFIKLRGRLDKTGFGNIAFVIEEILE